MEREEQIQGTERSEGFINLCRSLLVQRRPLGTWEALYAFCQVIVTFSEIRKPTEKDRQNLLTARSTFRTFVKPLKNRSVLPAEFDRMVEDPDGLSDVIKLLAPTAKEIVSGRCPASLPSRTAGSAGNLSERVMLTNPPPPPHRDAIPPPREGSGTFAIPAAAQ